MATAVAKKTPEVQESKGVGNRSLAPVSEIPTFLTRLRDEFDRWFDRYTRDWPSLTNSKGWRWGMDVKENDGNLIVTAEAPGFEADDFNLQVEDGRLVMQAARRTENKDKEEHSVREQECYQSITLPCAIDKNKVEATYHNGILTVTMPKGPNAMGRKVPVKTK